MASAAAFEAVSEDACNSSSRPDTGRSDESSASFNHSIENSKTTIIANPTTGGASSAAAGGAPPERLNPKLIRRSRPLPPPRTEGDTSSDDEQGEGRIGVTEEMRALMAARATQANTPQNPRRHLLHPGKYIPKEYKVGRPVPLTGLWECCGEESSTAMYCPSVESRGSVAKALEAQAAEEKRVEEKAKYVRENVRDVWEKDKTVGSVESHKVENDQERALREVSEHKSFFNIPMLVPYLYKKIGETSTFDVEQST